MKKVVLYIIFIFSIMVALFGVVYAIRSMINGDMFITLIFGIMTYVAYHMLIIPSYNDIKELKNE